MQNCICLFMVKKKEEDEKVTKVTFEDIFSCRGAPKNFKLGENRTKGCLNISNGLPFSPFVTLSNVSGSDRCFQVILAEPHFYVRIVNKRIVNMKVKMFPSSNSLTVV